MNYKNYFKRILIEAMISPEVATDAQSVDPSLSQQVPPQNPLSPKQQLPNFPDSWPGEVGNPPSQNPPDRSAYPPGKEGDREHRRDLRYWEDQWKAFLRRFSEWLRRNPARGFGRNTIPSDLPFNIPRIPSLTKPIENLGEQYEEWFLASMGLGMGGVEELGQGEFRPGMY